MSEFEYLDRVKVGKHGKVMEVAQSFPIGQVATVTAPDGTRLVVDWSEMTMVSPYPRTKISYAASLDPRLPLAA